MVNSIKVLEEECEQLEREGEELEHLIKETVAREEKLRENHTTVSYRLRTIHTNRLVILLWIASLS